MSGMPTAHWAIKYMQMLNVWTFDWVRIRDVLIYDSGIESKFQTFASCLFFIALWAVKSWILANPLEFSFPNKKWTEYLSFS